MTLSDGKPFLSMKRFVPRFMDAPLFALRPNKNAGLWPAHVFSLFPVWFPYRISGYPCRNFDKRRMRLGCTPRH